MDNLIEIVAPVFLEWQQILINNTSHSRYLVALVFFATMLITAFLLKDVVSGLKRKLIAEKKNLSLAETKRVELEKIQLHDAEEMAGLQQKHDQMQIKLEDAEKQTTSLQTKEKQLSKDLQARNTEHDKLNISVNEKSQLLDKLQGEFDQQKNKLSELVVEQLKIEEIERTAEKIDQESTRIKRQLQQVEEQLLEKNQLIEGFDKSDQTGKFNKDKIDALEAKISQLKNDNAQISNNKQTIKTDYVKELENAAKKRDQQLMQFNQQLQLLITNVTHPEEKKADIVPEPKEEEGFVNKVLAMFASLDKATTGENSIVSGSESVNQYKKQDKDIWQTHTNIIEQLTKQLIAEDDAKDILDAVEKTRLLAKKGVTELQENIVETSVEVKHVEVKSDKLEKLETFPQKLKGIYHKIIS